MSLTPINNRIASVLESYEATRIGPKDTEPDGVESVPLSIERTAADIDRCEDVDAPSVPPHEGGGNGNRPASTAVPPPDVANHTPPDPFDPANLRLNQDYGAGLVIKKLINTIPVRKPGKEVWVRTHPHPDYRLPTGVIELKEEREIYLVHPAIRELVATEATYVHKTLIVTVNRQGVLSLWPVRLPGPDGKIDDWNRSALEAADAARDSWVRVTANMDLGAYDITVAGGIKVEPEFPDLPMKEILRIAFKGKMIDSLDHVVLRKLRGEL